MRLRNCSKIITFALVLYGLATAAPSHAVPINYNFTINLLSDSHVGTLIGTFSGEDNVTADGKLDETELLSFMVTWSGPAPSTFTHDTSVTAVFPLPAFDYDIGTNTIVSFESADLTTFTFIEFDSTGVSTVTRFPDPGVEYPVNWQIVTSEPPVPDPSPNPEPGTYLLFSTGLVGILGYSVRQRRRLSSVRSIAS